jgi:hypothetical protein
VRPLDCRGLGQFVFSYTFWVGRNLEKSLAVEPTAVRVDSYPGDSKFASLTFSLYVYIYGDYFIINDIIIFCICSVLLRDRFVLLRITTLYCLFANFELLVYLY